jgi:hypothetical protein
MNIALNNSKLDLIKAPRPDSKNAHVETDATDLEHDNDLDESRKIGEELGVDPAQKTQGIAQEDRAVQALTGVANIGRKIGSKTLNVLGFVGITASALSYILFRFKILSAIIAAPAIGAFYIGNNLKAAVEKTEKESGLISDPREVIKKAKDDSIYLESNFKKVVAAMVRVGEMKDKDPKKVAALIDLAKIVKKVRAKETELTKVDKSSNMLLQIKHFIDIYDAIRAHEAQLEIESHEKQ